MKKNHLYQLLEIYLNVQQGYVEVEAYEVETGETVTDEISMKSINNFLNSTYKDHGLKEKNVFLAVHNGKHEILDSLDIVQDFLTIKKNIEWV